MTTDQVKRLVFDWISQHVGKLGCNGPPKCKLLGCKSSGHDTFLGVSDGTIRLEIDDDKFLVRVEKLDTGA